MRNIKILTVIGYAEHQVVSRIWSQLSEVVAAGLAAIVADTYSCKGSGCRIGDGCSVQVGCGLFHSNPHVDKLAGFHQVVIEGFVVHLFGFVFTNAGTDGKKVKGVVGNTAVDVYAAIIVTLGVLLIGVFGLPPGTVGGNAVVRVLQVAQCIVGIHPVLHYIFAHFPVVAVDHCAENIGEGFIQCAAFVLVFQVGCFFNHAVGHFMAANIQAAGQWFKNIAAVAIPHRRAVPEGVLHGRAVAFRYIYKSDDIAAYTVDRIPVKGIFEIVVTFNAVPMSAHRSGVVERSGVGHHKTVVKTRLVFRRSVHGVQRYDNTYGIVGHIGCPAVKHGFAGIFEYILSTHLPYAEIAVDIQEVEASGCNGVVFLRR